LLPFYLEKFEGYFQYPRPISSPFFNENLKKEEIEKLNNILSIEKGRFGNTKNLHNLKLKSNQGLHYLTSSLTLSDDNSKKKLIETIDNYIEDFKLQNKFLPDLVETDGKIKALRRFKKILLCNLGEKIIHGRHLPSPDKSNYEKMENNKKLIDLKINKRRLQESRNCSVGKGKEFLSHNNSLIGKAEVSNGFNLQLINSYNKSSTFFNKEVRDKENHLNDLSFCKNIILKNLYFKILVSNKSEEEKNIKNDNQSSKIKLRSTLEMNYEEEKRLLTGFKVI
jgi:hypothetical protein